MAKESRRGASAGGKATSRELQDRPVLPAIIDRQIPDRAKMLLVGLAVSAFESALSEDAEAVLVQFALLRETFRELEAVFQQMSRDAPVNKRVPRKGPAKSTEVREGRSRRRR